jgi:hypothetical protein
MPQHQPDNRKRVLKTTDAEGNELVVNVKLPPGMSLDPVKATTEAKPKPPQADDPRPSFHRNVGGPYAV